MKNATRSPKWLTLAILPATILSLSGCATICSSRYQKVSFHNTTPGAKVIYPTDGMQSKNSTKFDKMRTFHTVRVEKDGFKSANYSFQLTKRAPTFAFAVLDLAIPLYGWFYGIPIDLWHPKTRKFDKKQNVPALLPYDKRKADEKYMLVNNTAFDAKGADIKWHQYLGLSDYRGSKHNDTRSIKKLNRSKDREDLKVDNTIFTTALNGTLKNMNFVDTTHTLFPSAANTVYLDATVKKIVIHDVESRLARKIKRRSAAIPMNDLVAIEMEIEWKLLDYYKQTIYETKTTQKSDLFTFKMSDNKEKFNDMLRDAMEDNLEYSLMKIRTELTEKGLLKVSSAAKQPVLATITIPRPKPAENSRMNDYLKSSVIVKVDDGHGSGAVIAANGYIVTAYHVVAGSKKTEVIFSDGTKAEATCPQERRG